MSTQIHKLFSNSSYGYFVMLLFLLTTIMAVATVYMKEKLSKSIYLFRKGMSKSVFKTVSLLTTLSSVIVFPVFTNYTLSKSTCTTTTNFENNLKTTLEKRNVLPTIQLKTVDSNGQNICCIQIFFVSQLDTIASVANSDGLVIVRLPHPGKWSVNIASYYYLSKTTYINITDSFFFLIDTLTKSSNIGRDFLLNDMIVAKQDSNLAKQILYKALAYRKQFELIEDADSNNEILAIGKIQITDTIGQIKAQVNRFLPYLDDSIFYYIKNDFHNQVSKKIREEDRLDYFEIERWGMKWGFDVIVFASLFNKFDIIKISYEASSDKLQNLYNLPLAIRLTRDTSIRKYIREADSVRKVSNVARPLIIWMLPILFDNQSSVVVSQSHIDIAVSMENMYINDTVKCNGVYVQPFDELSGQGTLTIEGPNSIVLRKRLVLKHGNNVVMISARNKSKCDTSIVNIIYETSASKSDYVKKKLPFRKRLRKKK